MRRKMSKIKEETNDKMIFNVLSKKNNQTSVSDADREIPTLGSTALSVYHRVEISLSELETDDRFFLS